jgi:hypothetical protein
MGDLARRNALSLHALSAVRANLPSLTREELGRLSRIRNLSVPIRNLSSQTQVFRTLHPDTDVQVYSFDVKVDSEAKSLAVMLMEIDEAVSRHLPKFVPKFVDEGEFWSNYVSHVIALRRRLLKEQSILELAAATTTTTSDVANMPTQTNTQRRFSAWGENSPLLLLPELSIATVDLGADDDEDLVLISPREKSGGSSRSSIIIRRLLDFGSPRMLDVILTSLARDRGDLGCLMTGEEYCTLCDTLRLRVEQPSVYLSTPTLLVLPKALKDALFAFEFRSDRDEPAAVAAFELNPVGVNRALQATVPLLVPETVGWTHCLRHVALVVYEAFARRSALI